MADNRLFLKCKRTGERVKLANYTTGAGWWVQDYKTLAERLAQAFAKDNSFQWPDANVHELEYESEMTGQDLSE